MIFISHTHSDKAIVDPIAIRLGDIFGKEQVFYDAWSIQPGDGIIERMSQGLTDCKYFFFFVSKNSLKSKMVDLEWQNALFKATRGTCKIVPVRLDECEMPSVLLQTLYIDLNTYGIEAAITQIVSVIQGNNTFVSKDGFSNIGVSVEERNREMLLTISASHYFEPIGVFAIAVRNDKSDLKFSTGRDIPLTMGFIDSKIIDGVSLNFYRIDFMRGLTPSLPFRIKIDAIQCEKVLLHGVLHMKGENLFKPIPCRR